MRRIKSYLGKFYLIQILLGAGLAFLLVLMGRGLPRDLLLVGLIIVMAFFEMTFGKVWIIDWFRRNKPEWYIQYLEELLNDKKRMESTSYSKISRIPRIRELEAELTALKAK